MLHDLIQSRSPLITSTSISVSLAAAATAATIIFLTTRALDLWYRKRRARNQYACRDAVMYPHRDRFFGSDLLKLRKSALRSGRLKLLYLEHHRLFGETWQEIADGGIRINTTAAANLRYIYALHTSAFRKTSRENAASMALLGRGVLTSEGDEWRWNRKLIMPTFSKYESKTMPILKEHVDRFIQSVPRDGRTFDIQTLFKKLFLDLATDFLFGEPLGLQLASKQVEAEEFLRTLDSALLGLNKRRQDFNLTSVRLWLDQSYAEDIAKVHAFIDVRVQAALNRTSRKIHSSSLDAVRNETRNEASEPAKNSIKFTRSTTDRYILADEMACQIRDSSYLRGALLQCFLPGRDSPAILLSNTLFELARHPEHWAFLRSTLSLEANNIGSVNIIEGDDALLSFQKLNSLRHVKNAIYEALRLHGPGGGNRRVAAQDIILPEGGGLDGKSPLFVPRGTSIQTHLPVMHRNKTYWGDDADEFRPSRFVERPPHAGSAGDVFGWEFKPFLGGPRTCPAKDQVIIQAVYVMVRLLKEFETIENRDEVLEFIEIARLTTESRRGVKIGFRICLIGSHD